MSDADNDKTVTYLQSNYETSANVTFTCVVECLLLSRVSSSP